MLSHGVLMAGGQTRMLIYIATTEEVVEIQPVFGYHGGAVVAVCVTTDVAVLTISI